MANFRIQVPEGLCDNLFFRIEEFCKWFLLMMNVLGSDLQVLEIKAIDIVWEFALLDFTLW